MTVAETLLQPAAAIRILPDHVVSKIAAGEVVERPGSVVKELVENSLDAGASQLVVDIEEGGRDLIRVVDNGKGIPFEQLPLAVAAHATSKVQSADDLFQIGTFGFRGEAIHSIAGISNFTLVSRTESQPTGGLIRVEHGRVVEHRECASPVGTRIEVRDLFASVPVRRKFLKSKQTEFAQIAEMVTRLALSRQGIHVKLSNGTRVVYERPANADLRATINCFFGDEMAKNLIEIDHQMADLRIRGFVCDPKIDRPNNRYQYLFVNGRAIRDRSLSYAISEAYRGLIMTQRWPVVFLFMEMPTDQVDVNVHPTKAEVRFHDPHRLFSLVLSSIRTKFLSVDLTPTLRPPTAPDKPEQVYSSKGDIEPATGLPGDFFEDDRKRIDQFVLDAGSTQKPDPRLWDQPALPIGQRPSDAINQHLSPSSDNSSTYGQQADTRPQLNAQFNRASDGSSPAVARSPISNESWNQHPQGLLNSVPIAPGHDQSVGQPGASQSANTFERSNAPAKTQAEGFPRRADEIPQVGSARPMPTTGPTVCAPPVERMRALQLHNSYLVVETEEGMLLIDQHALHERIMYEMLRDHVNRRNLEVQELLVPEPIELPPAQVSLLVDAKDVLAEVGISVEEFNQHCVLVQSMPTLLRRQSIESVIQEIASQLEETGNVPSKDRLLEDLLHMCACKAAVKAGDPLSPAEIEALVEQRHLVENSHHCPHGRPTVLKFTLKELEKQFRRI